jgi:hypothetical protein
MHTPANRAILHRASCPVALGRNWKGLIHLHWPKHILSQAVLKSRVFLILKHNDEDLHSDARVQRNENPAKAKKDTQLPQQLQHSEVCGNQNQAIFGEARAFKGRLYHHCPQ